MQIVADSHVHIYPNFISRGLFPAIAARMDALAGGPHVNILCLAERRGSDWFKSAKKGKLSAAGDFSVETLASDEVGIIISSGDASPIYVMAGRQIVTRERLEILALVCDAKTGDGLPARDVVSAVLDEGGIPVVSWAPGKWSLGRGAVVKDLLERMGPGRLLVGDSAIRPKSWAEPSLMSFARGLGITVVAGSDPLPLDGEEKYIGSYCSRFDCELDRSRPAAAVREFLRSEGAVTASVGGRCSLLAMMSRLVRLRFG